MFEIQREKKPSLFIFYFFDKFISVVYNFFEKVFEIQWSWFYYLTIGQCWYTEKVYIPNPFKSQFDLRKHFFFIFFFLSFILHLSSLHLHINIHIHLLATSTTTSFVSSPTLLSFLMSFSIHMYNQNMTQVLFDTNIFDIAIEIKKSFGFFFFFSFLFSFYFSISQNNYLFSSFLSFLFF